MDEKNYERLQRAAKMYSQLTGEAVDLGGITVDKPEEDAKAKAEKLQKQQAAESKVQKAKEDADQQLRKLKVAQQTGDDIQDENPGPGQPAMVTERAKAAGVSRKGEEPQRKG